MTMFRYVAAVLLLLVPGHADAGLFRARVRVHVQASPCADGRCDASARVVVPAPVPVPVPAVAPAQVPVGADPYAAVNSIRAQHGLAPLAPDPELAAWAASNSTAQAAHRRCGHFVAGPGCWQCAAPPTADPVGMWYGDAPHRAILLNSTLTRCGIDCSGGYWTINLR